MIKKRVKMNKPVNLRMSVLDISKIAMNHYWYGYVKAKFRKKAKIYNMNRNSYHIYAVR